jgi:hypothetical protein
MRERERERENYICSSHLGLIRWRTGTPQEIETIRERTRLGFWLSSLSHVNATIFVIVSVCEQCFCLSLYALPTAQGTSDLQEVAPYPVKLGVR